MIDLLYERKRRGMSQEDMASRVGVTRRVWAGAENGAEPRGESALTIARFFDCEITDIWPVHEKDAA